ncbi:hypothetical protein A9Q78_10760 [Methylophaga sp. 41_12_T18]|nr:hypothetical protein A9Q78_10760 [Methylophaga sp. 41_12_T18]
MSIWPFTKLKLRSKLLLVSLVILLLPWFGVKYIQVVERLLQQQQAQTVATIVKATATLVEQYPSLLTQRDNTYRQTAGNLSSVVTAVTSPIQVDGYNDDWLEYYELLQTLPANNQLNSQQKLDPQTLSARYIFAQQQQQLKLFLDVVDDQVKLRNPRQLKRHGGDAIILAITDKKQRSQRYILTTSAPGKVNAYEYIGSYLDPVIVKAEPLIKAAWQLSPYGYRLELSLPLSAMGDSLALAIVDIDSSEQLAQVIGLGDVNNRNKFSKLWLPSVELSHVLAKMAGKGERLWLVDRQQIKFASAGKGDIEIGSQELTTAVDWLYQLFLTPPISDDESISHEQLVLAGPAVKSALAGHSETERRQTSKNDAVMLVAAHPIHVDGQVIAAVVVEKNTNAILAIQNEAMKALLDTTLLVIFIVVVVLFGFASYLSIRIRRLNRDIALAVNDDGRVSGCFDIKNEYDELGELRQNFGQLFTRLGLYNHYLEALASRLSHELRTPIAVIKTSLEHVETYVDDEGQRYLERARTGSDRINDIVARMSEASRLEQTVSTIEFTNFELQQLIKTIFQAYQDIYPNVGFDLKFSPTTLSIFGSQELIVQMLDKLVANAVDFHTDGSRIELSIINDENSCSLAIKNTGVQLPDGMDQQVFQPMVSERSCVDDVKPHLGLGLYIVKLIVEQHKGTVHAENWQQGVEIFVELPIVRP